jgi:two-component system, cell cycle response regulator CpdR
VDDEAEVTIFLADLLSIEGFVVETARDGADALSRLGQGAFDALLVDLRMPVSGLDLLDGIERQFPALRQRVVFMTGDVFYAEQLPLAMRTTIPLVIKPFRAEELAQALRDVLSA